MKLKIRKRIWVQTWSCGGQFMGYIQSDSGGICITLGNDSMSDSKQKSSYEHGSDFERLRSYGHFLIPSCEPRLRNQLAACGLLYS